MPTYQYACTECGDRLEVVQRFSDDPLSVCAACGGRLRKVFSPVGIVFKGSGFYRTDSRSGVSSAGNGKAAADGASSGASSGSDGGSAGSGGPAGSGGSAGRAKSDGGGSAGRGKPGAGSAKAGSPGTSSKVA